MTDAPKTPFDALFQQSQEISEALLKAAAPGMAAGQPEHIWPEIPAGMLEAFMGKQFNPEGLEAKTRLLLILQGLTIQGARAKAQFRTTVRQAISLGTTPQEIAETIGLASLFGGPQVMTKAMALAKQAIDGDGEDD